MDLKLFNFIRALAAIAVIFIAGYVVFKLVFNRKKESFGGYALLAVYFGLGAGSVALFSLFCLLLRVPFFWVVVILPLLLLALILNGSFRRLVLIRIQAGGAGKSRDSLTGNLNVFGIIIAFAVLLVLFNSLIFPMRFFDSRVLWNFKAKIIFERNTVYCGDFLDASRIHLHPDYPLMLPALEAFVYEIIGEPDDWAIMLIMPLFYIMLLFFFYDSVKSVSGRKVAMLSSASLALLPPFFMLDGPVHSGLADVPLAFFFSVSFLSCCMYMRKRCVEFLVMGGIFGGFCCMLKNEGVLLALLNLSCVLFYSLLYSRETTVRAVLSFAVPAVLVYLPNFLLTHSIPGQPLSGEPEIRGYLHGLKKIVTGECLSRIPVIAGYYLREFFLRINRWGLLWYAFLFGLAAAFIRGNRKEVIAAVVPVIYLLCMAFVYAVTPYPQGFIAHMDISLHREILHVAPSVLFMIPMLLEMPGNPEQRVAEE
jgi:hypothetical protein